MRFCFAYWSLVLVTTLSGWPQSLLAGDAAPAWQLRPVAQTGLAGMCLDEFFATSPQIVPHVRVVGSSVPFGQTVSFTRAQIADLLREQTPDLVLSNWIGPAQIKITRRKRALDE